MIRIPARFRPTLRARSLRAATFAGIGALSLAAAAQAQEGPRLNGLEPCLQTHFDPARYVADLVAAGWHPLAEGERDAALLALTDAFLVMRGTDFDPAAPEASTTRAEHRAHWAGETAGRNMFQRGAQTLFIAGDAHTDGRLRVTCWFAAPEGDAVMADVWRIMERAGRTDQAGVVTRAAIPETPVSANASVELFATALPVDAMTPPLSVGQGLLVRLILAAPDASAEGG